jgi:hypothetical protein
MLSFGHLPRKEQKPRANYKKFVDGWMMIVEGMKEQGNKVEPLRPTRRAAIVLELFRYNIMDVSSSDI